jgi:cytochrome P450
VSQDIATQIDDIRNGTDDSHEKVAHRTVFHDILSSSLPAIEKRTSRLADEGATIVSAATGTTAWALSVTVYYLLTNPDVLRQLKNEIITAIPDPSVSTPLATLENLPYLTGVVKEGLRLSYGPGRFERIAPDEDLIFTETTTSSTTKKTWIIPRGTPMSQTTYLLHRNPVTFPSPEQFNPNRWIENPRLDKCLTTFAKGKMSCVGRELAYAEIYLILAKIFRVMGSETVRGEGDWGKMVLYETRFERDVDVKRDHFLPLPSRDSKGIRVTVELYQKGDK